MDPDFPLDEELIEIPHADDVTTFREIFEAFQSTATVTTSANFPGNLLPQSSNLPPLHALRPRESPHLRRPGRTDLVQTAVENPGRSITLPTRRLPFFTALSIISLVGTMSIISLVGTSSRILTRTLFDPEEHHRRLLSRISRHQRQPNRHE